MVLMSLLVRDAAHCSSFSGVVDSNPMFGKVFISVSSSDQTGVCRRLGWSLGCYCEITHRYLVITLAETCLLKHC